MIHIIGIQNEKFKRGDRISGGKDREYWRFKGGIEGRSIERSWLCFVFGHIDFLYATAK
ncbi:MAG: hypothetical protein KDD67_13025 [Ignavibacteriae bacterium]|nr:hypothetical protein [Ignavibacteriota bacterium]MCB9214399.1 hypothetical protein [Ignavibacteria bacterium]